MNIVLADTHGPILGKDPCCPNLSLLYLASYARRHVPALDEVHYIPQRAQFEDHARIVAETQAAVYGLSFTSYGAPLAYELTRTLREQFPNLLVVCGGPHASALPRQTLDESGADIVAIGEGEQTFAEILNQLTVLPAARANISGIAYRDDAGAYQQTGPRPLIDDLDTIPFRDRSLVRDDDYIGLSFSRGKPNAEMVIMRGCPFRCTFCANPVYRVDGPGFRARSPEAIAIEADSLYQAGYREIYLHSDELNVSQDWSIEVCKALAALGHDDLYFQCNLRAAPVNAEFARWLKKANFWLVRFGIESASPRVLRGIKKQMAVENTVEACRLVSETGVRTWGYFLLFQYWEEQGTLTFETPEEIRATLRFAWRLWRQGTLQYSSWACAMPVPGAEMFDIGVRHGLIQADHCPRTCAPSNLVDGATRR